MTPEFSRRYRLGKQLRYGAMSTTFEAVQLSLGRRVVVKFLPDGAEPELRDRFVREAEILMGMRVDGVLPLIDSGIAGDRLYLVLPYVDGKNLQQVLNERGPMGWPETRRIALRLLEALGTIHEQGILHRDIKPENILLPAQGGEPFLIDFGVSLLRTAPRLTLPGPAFMGSLLFAAPEQVLAEEFDARADIYAMGVTLHFALLGRYPHQAEEPGVLVNSKLNRRIESIPVQTMGLPAAVEPILIKALEPLRSARFESASAFREAILAVDPAPAHIPVMTVTPQAIRTGAPPLRFSFWWRIASLIGMIALLLGSMQDSDEPGPRAEKLVSAPGAGPREDVAEVLRLVETVLERARRPGLRRDPVSGRVIHPDDMIPVAFQALVRLTETATRLLEQRTGGEDWLDLARSGHAILDLVAGCGGMRQGGRFSVPMRKLRTIAQDPYDQVHFRCFSRAISAQIKHEEAGTGATLRQQAAAMEECAKLLEALEAERPLTRPELIASVRFRDLAVTLAERYQRSEVLEDVTKINGLLARNREKLSRARLPPEAR